MVNLGSRTNEKVPFVASIVAGTEGTLYPVNSRILCPQNMQGNGLTNLLGIHTKCAPHRI